MSLKSPLGRVLGLGSTGTGTEHWLGQRLSAVAMVPLTLWFALSLLASAALLLGGCGSTVKLDDKAGNIWFGSADAGACRYDGKTFTNFSATVAPGK